MFFKKLKFNSDAGYSLMELMAVIAIISIMSAVAATGYSENKKSAALDKAVQQLALDLRRAQNMAMNTAVFGGSVPAGGYGIHLTVSSGIYTLYADTNGNKQYDGSDGVVLTKTLDSPIIVDTVTNNVTDIDFLPPNPIVYFNGGTVINTTAITLKYGASGPAKTITVNRLTGQISVN